MLTLLVFNLSREDKFLSLLYRIYENICQADQTSKCKKKKSEKIKVVVEN